MSQAIETPYTPPQRTPEEIEYIRAALIQGENSGWIRSFDFDKFEKEMEVIYAEEEAKKNRQLKAG